MIEFTPENKTGRRVLLTPGPLTTSRAVREAMNEDIGSWDDDCIELVADIRRRLLHVAGDPPDYTVTLLQGAGSYGVEAMLGSAVPREGKLLILSNGAYGKRMARSSAAMGLNFTVLEDPEDQPHAPEAVDRALAGDLAITHVAVVHCETTTGLLNPVREIGHVVQRHGRRYLVDAISSFGAYPTDFGAGPVDHLVATANKCIEGVPGFCFVISRRAAMEEAAGNARSYCFDLHGQWRWMESSGKFRFTPPTHVLLAFQQALWELEKEGGVAARARRYCENQATLAAGMAALGFHPLIRPEHQSHIITTFLYPRPDFDFMAFYTRLREQGYIIYPGKLTQVDTFRVANIGSIGREEIEGFLRAAARAVA
jgi:2-aminoethylphosphonate-pyruvate transaminase